MLDRYQTALKKEIIRWGGLFGRPIDTIYIGGGTPSLLGERIEGIIYAIRQSFAVDENAEITAELNPEGDIEQFLLSAGRAGVNRLSVGIQSANDDELLLLGRRHTALAAMKAVVSARNLGFSNISVDLMLGLPHSNTKSLKRSIDFALSLSPEHISAYILKVEKNTPFGRSNGLALPDDDMIAEQYGLLCDTLRNRGLLHYEISNFAKAGYESRHNLKYWRGEEYLGIGPAAHSFVEGRRFYYPRSLHSFLKNPEIIPDGAGGGLDELIMLSLRLCEGYDFEKYPALLPYLSQLEGAGLGQLEGTGFSLTDRGMLVSNSIITEILERL